MATRSRCTAAIGLLSLALAAAPAFAQGPVTFVGMGDSLGEGVQSGDANEYTQPFSYLNFMAWRMGAELPLPLIKTGLFGAVGDISGRSRNLPTVRSRNLAVSGATVHSILYDAATATTVAQIDTETELVLFPQIGSQIDIAEPLRPTYVACWIGNNDALGAILAWSNLNATQLTPLASFTTDFTNLVTRLDAAGAKVVFSTIPDVTSIGYLLNRQELIRFLGQDYGLPAGSLTTVPAMMMVRFGLLSPSVFSDPNYILDPAEQQIINNRIEQFNSVIYSTVTAHHMALVDIHGIFQYLAGNGVSLFGVNLTTRFLGGLFSLDGVHPSNIGQGLVALFFIDALNQTYGANIPQMDGNTLFWLTATDPFIDKDGDGRVTGRFGVGLLETVFNLIGISGDPDDGTLSLAGPSLSTSARGDGATGTAARSTMTERQQQTRALDEIARVTGRDLRTMTRDEQADAVQRMFGGSPIAR